MLMRDVLAASSCSNVAFYFLFGKSSSFRRLSKWQTCWHPKRMKYNNRPSAAKHTVLPPFNDACVLEDAWRCFNLRGSQGRVARSQKVSSVFVKHTTAALRRTNPHMVILSMLQMWLCEYESVANSRTIVSTVNCIVHKKCKHFRTINIKSGGHLVFFFYEKIIDLKSS